MANRRTDKRDGHRFIDEEPPIRRTKVKWSRTITQIASAAQWQFKSRNHTWTLVGIVQFQIRNPISFEATPRASTISAKSLAASASVRSRRGIWKCIKSGVAKDLQIIERPSNISDKEWERRCLVAQRGAPVRANRELAVLKTLFSKCIALSCTKVRTL